MPNVTLWTGLPGSGREPAAGKRALEAARTGKTVWWLVDSQRRAEAVESRLLDFSGGAYAGIEVVVAGRLPMQALQFAGQETRAISTEIRELILQELLEERSQQRNMPATASEGWVRKLVEFYLRLQAGEEFLEANLAARYPWALELLRGYRELLADRGRVDESDLPAIALRSLTEGRLLPPALFVVDRIGPVQPDVMDLIHELGMAAEETIVIADWVTGGGPALELSRQHLQEWRGKLQCTEKTFTAEENLAELYRRLFTAKEESPGSSPRVALSYHPDRTAEVRAVARELSRLVHEEGLPPESTAVICTRLDDYEALIGELFPLYGLTPDIRIGPRLDRNPVVKAVLTLFDLRAGGLVRERLTDLLLNPHVRWGRTLSTAEGVLFFDTAARRARISEGRGSFESVWREPLEATLDRLRQRAQQLRVDPEAEEDLEDENGGLSNRIKLARLEREITTVERALGELQELAKLIYSLPDSCTSAEASNWLHGLLAQLGVLDAANRAARVNPDEGGEDIRALGQINLAMDHVASALSLHGRERWPVARLSEALHQALGGVRLKVSSRLRGGVQVGGPLELRGLRTANLFLLGMTASRWPRDPELDLADPLAGHWSQIDRLAESRSITTEAIVANRNVRITVPAPSDGEGSEAPSPLLAELAAAGIELVEPEGDETVRSPLEFLSEAGQRKGDERSELLDSLGDGTGLSKREIERTAEIEGVRQDPATLTRYEGQLTGEPVAELIAERTLSRPLSATRLDGYARCPMQYFLGSVLDASGLEEVEEGVDPREVGDILHRILAESVRRLHTRRGGAPDLTENPEEIAQVMEGVALEELEHFPMDNLFGDIVRESILSGLLDESEPSGYLRDFLNKQTVERDSAQLRGGRTVAVEASFGLPEEEGTTVLLDKPIVIEHDGISVPLAGRLDRIDEHPEKGWRVYDYKVSKSTQPSADKSIEGLSFQLPVYTWALKEWLAQGHGDPDSFEIARFIQFKPDKAVLSRGWKADVHDARSEELKERVVGIHEAMRSGRYHHPLSLDGKLCPEDVSRFYCPFKHVCRRDPSLFRERPSALTRDQLEGAYTLAFQEFSALERPDGEGDNG